MVLGKGENTLIAKTKIKFGKEKDLQKGHYHISWACDRNNALACNLEAFFYKDGLSVRKNRNKALKLFEKSCKLEFKQGCENYEMLKKQK